MKELHIANLKTFLQKKLDWDPSEISISPLAGGYSNLTYLLESPAGKFALRRPPFGFKITSAHDMAREYKVLTSLEQAGYHKIPKPILLEESEEILGAPFLLMTFVEGLVLRQDLPIKNYPSRHEFEKLSQQAIECLLELHQLDLNDSQLIELGKPDGYVSRQVSGWASRYINAKTDPIPEMEKIATWLAKNQPKGSTIAFIHNDFKYDNLILSPTNLSSIEAVLDWEMSTVGDPLMDLGTSLAYWTEADDPDILKLFNLSHLPGNMNRKEVIETYANKSGISMNHILFYYVFGLFKVAVIAQQIYRRFKLGQTNDRRFSALIEVVKAAATKAEKSILTEKI